VTVKAPGQLARRYREQGGRCWYCDLPTWSRRNETRLQARERLGVAAGTPQSSKVLRKKAATREHLARVADGGGDALRNIVMACAGCNVLRGDRDPVTWRAEVQAQLAAGTHWWQVYAARAREHLAAVVAGTARGQVSVAQAAEVLASGLLDLPPRVAAPCPPGEVGKGREHGRAAGHQPQGGEQGDEPAPRAAPS